MKSYPDTDHDDRTDTVCLGVEHFHGELNAERIGVRSPA
jgi:hypothetical protein